jgi:hypothetical protein
MTTNTTRLLVATLLFTSLYGCKAPETLTTFTTTEGVKTAAILSSKYNRNIPHFSYESTEYIHETNSLERLSRHTTPTPEELELVAEAYDHLIKKIKDEGIEIEHNIAEKDLEKLEESANIHSRSLTESVNKVNVTLPTLESKKGTLFNIWAGKVQRTRKVNFAKEACEILNVDAVITIDMGFAVVATASRLDFRAPEESHLAFYSKVSAVNRQGEHIINDLHITYIPTHQLSKPERKIFKKHIKYNEKTAPIMETTAENYIASLETHTLQSRYYNKHYIRYYQPRIDYSRFIKGF